MDIPNLLGMPINASAHGGRIDSMLFLMHIIMVILFVGWGIFFLYCLVRFRKSRQPKADYHGVKNHYSTWLEGAVAVVEILFLVGLAFPVWSDIKTRPPSEKEADVVVRVVAQQFAWNVHYPGADGEFGRRDINLVSDDNVLGLDKSDPKAADDITTINQLNLPENKLVLVKLTSQDVIHSFSLPQMRVKQDAIPGMEIPVYFKPTKTGNWEIACAQLCGLAHYRMRGYLNIQSNDDYAQWLKEQVEGDEDGSGNPGGGTAAGESQGEPQNRPKGDAGRD